MVVFAHVFAGGSWDVSLDITTTAGRVSGRYGGDGVGDGISGMGGVEGPSGRYRRFPEVSPRQQVRFWSGHQLRVLTMLPSCRCGRAACPPAQA